MFSCLGPDGTRRSRRARKKPRVLTEYETGAIEGVEEPPDLADPDDDPRDADVKIPIALLNPSSGQNQAATMSTQALGEIYADNAVYSVTEDGTVIQTSGKQPEEVEANQETNQDVEVTTVEKKKRPKVNQAINSLQNYLANLGLPVKRGRGRPRRRPLPMSGDGNSRVPAFIIPAPDGQAVMMTPVQGVDTNKFDSQAITNSQLTKVLQTGDNAASSSNTIIINTSTDSSQISGSNTIIINNADGSQTCVIQPQQIDATSKQNEQQEDLGIMEEMLTAAAANNETTTTENNLENITLPAPATGNITLDTGKVRLHNTVVSCYYDTAGIRKKYHNIQTIEISSINF